MPNNIKNSLIKILCIAALSGIIDGCKGLYFSAWDKAHKMFYGDYPQDIQSNGYNHDTNEQINNNDIKEGNDDEQEDDDKEIEFLDENDKPTLKTPQTSPSPSTSNTTPHIQVKAGNTKLSYKNNKNNYSQHQSQTIPKIQFNQNIIDNNNNNNNNNNADDMLISGNINLDPNNNNNNDNTTKSPSLLYESNINDNTISSTPVSKQYTDKEKQELDEMLHNDDE